MSKENIKRTLIVLASFVLSAGISYGATTYLYSENNSPSPVVTPPPGGQLIIADDAPKTAVCPLNGKMYTETEKGVWESRRPIFAMLENSLDARPQSGLNSADIIYEAVAEGGITRMGVLFYCGVSAKDTTIAPVRSARTTFVELASEYNYPLYVHAGGANCSSADGGKTCTSDRRAMAIEQIASYGWSGSNDLDEFGIGIKAFRRDLARLWDIKGKEVAWEHGLTASTEKLFQYAKDVRKWTNLDPAGKNEWADSFVDWTFKDDSKTKGNITKVSYGFWDSNKNFDTTWEYELESNTYTRNQGGEKSLDLNDNNQVRAKVVIVQFTKELGPLDIHKHYNYEVIGTGKALVFQDGQVTEATWNKKNREGRTTFKDSKGKAIDFNRGLIYIAVVSTGNKVDY